MWKCLAGFLGWMLLLAGAQGAIAITNHEPGSTVRYPLVLLRGKLDPAATSIQVTNTSSNRDTRQMTGQVHEGQFKILAELIEGENRLQLQSDASQAPLDFQITYLPQTNPHYVRVIWMTDNTGATDYATCVENDPQNYAEKLDASIKFLQTFTAERMHDLGYGRKTFRLELDEEGTLVVHTLKAPKAAEHYYRMNDQAWYGEVSRWLTQQHLDPYAKNIVLAAFTRKDPETGKMLAHTALGGGKQGLFGSGSVFSWPNSIADIQPAFLNPERFDASRVHNDGAGRHTFWGVASTTMGATLHEMGHAFGLPHCTDRWGIMTRGFDHLNRAATFQDPPSGRKLKPYFFPDSEVAYFAPISASFLQWSPWFWMDEKEQPEPPSQTLTYDAEADVIHIANPYGIRWVGFWVRDNVAKFQEFRDADPPKELVITRADWQKILGEGATLSRVTMMGDDGRSRGLRLPK